MEEQFIICDCRHCGNGIEFEAHQLDPGESRNIDCPHCGRETTLSRPAVKPAAAIKIVVTPKPASQPVAAPPATARPPAAIASPQPIPSHPTSGRGKKRTLAIAATILVLCLAGLAVAFALTRPAPEHTAAGYDRGYELGIMGYVNSLPQLDPSSLTRLATMLSVTNGIQGSDQSLWVGAFTNGYSTAFVAMKGSFGKGYMTGWNYRKLGRPTPDDSTVKKLAKQENVSDATAWARGFKLALGHAQ